MALKYKPLLTITIPTFNRATYLNSCLESIFQQMHESMDVEVVVSNNCSTDNTYEIVKQYLTKKQFKYFEQISNIGFALNVLESVKLASGEYCWIIGDDDFLIQGALEAVLNILNKNINEIDYYYASVRGIHIDEYNLYKKPFSTLNLSENYFIEELECQAINKFEELITPKFSIIFLGELMVSIFRREIWSRYNQTENFQKGFLNNLETTYPHSVVLANTFLNSRAIYIKTPLLLCLDGAREWWDKLGYILVVEVKNLLDLYENLGVSKSSLIKCYKSYLHMSFKYFLKFLFNRNSRYKDKVNLKEYSFFLLQNLGLTISFFYTVIVGKTKAYLKGHFK